MAMEAVMHPHMMNAIGISAMNETDPVSGYSPQPMTFTELFLASIKIVVGVIGVLGNAIVCLIVKRLRLQQVNLLIFTQAIIDLFTSVILVLNTFTVDLFPPGKPGFGYLYCVYWYSRVILFIMYSISTFNLVAIAIERYISILHPFWYRENYSRSRAAAFAAVLWLFAPIVQIVHATISVGFRDGDCAYFSLSTTVIAVIGSFIFVWEYLLPCTVMGFCSIRISYALKQADNSAVTLGRVQDPCNDDANNPSNAVTKRSRNITKTLIVVFAVYVICWSTNQFLFLQYNLGGTLDFGGALYGFAVGMAQLNVACNPFIYAFRYRQYQKELRKICRKISERITSHRSCNSSCFSDNSNC